MIPAVLHRIWPGDDPMPPLFEQWGVEWKRMHPDWEHYCWLPSQLSGWMVNQHVYDVAENHDPKDFRRFRSSLARLEIMYRYGGIYVDTDTLPLRPIDELRENEAFLVQSPNQLHTVTDCAMGSIPGHPFFKQVIDALEQSVIDHRQPDYVRKEGLPTPVLLTVGPWFLTRELERFGRDKVCVLPWWTFAGGSIVDRQSGRTPDVSRAYAEHKWNNSRRRDGVGLG